MKIINIGVLAHVDAGKTTLTEQFLFESGIINQLGSVDQGSTATDSLDLERKRGITIKAAAVSFMAGDVKVNLIDTPGHADFISEVEHSLSVLDGAILVISAVEGVQAQTRVLMKSLKQFQIPTVLFMNKIDRMGADYERVCFMIRQFLDEQICEMSAVDKEGISTVSVKDRVDKSAWLEVLALTNDRLLAAYVAEEKISEKWLEAALVQQTKEAKAYPLFVGSAAKGIGIQSLLAALTTFFPSSKKGGALSGGVFKLIQLPTGEQEAYVRLYGGQICVRTEVPILRRGNEPFNLKVKHLHKLENGKQISADIVVAGDIAILTGKKLQVGDALGQMPKRMTHSLNQLPPIQVTASPKWKEDEAVLHQALTRLAAEDPFLHYSRDPKTVEHSIRVFGEVQQEIVKETILAEYGISIDWSQPEIVCIEKPSGTGRAVERIGDPFNPFYATIGFRVERGQEGSGFVYQLEVELGSLPLAFQRAIEETVAHVLQEGLYGWCVKDIIVTLTHTGYASPVSTARDFRALTPLVFMEALKQAGTSVYEPLENVQLIVPERFLPKVLTLVTRHGGSIWEPVFKNGLYEVGGSLPVRTVAQVKAGIRAVTSGEGILSTRLSGYKQTGTKSQPVKQRRQLNPLNRTEYLLFQSKTM